MLEEDIRRHMRKASNAKMGVTASLSKHKTAVVVKIKEEKSNEDQTVREDNDVVQKAFVLPPEYDENDSRWTLKYRECAAGLVELMPRTGVYVNADKLDECQRLSKVCKILARLLPTEIFTASALRTCSWSRTAKDSNIDGGQARPGLDEHARIILLKFVEEYGLIRGWIITDYQCILNHMRQIMLDMRHVKQKKDNEELRKIGSNSRMRQTTLEVSHDALKEVEDYDGLFVKPSHLPMRRVRLIESEDDYDIFEEGSYTHLNRKHLKMICDTQREDEDEDDKVFSKSSHTRSNKTVVEMRRERECEPQKGTKDFYDEGLIIGSHTHKLVLPPDFDDAQSLGMIAHHRHFI